MLQVLLVDDEKLTREGLLERVPWQELGIGKVVEADDGKNAIERCKNFTPDIILTDVRMPRMDGVEMSFELMRRFPESKLIFMSGYSDKEYLRSAIELKALSYIDKPINFQEMLKTLKLAVTQCQEERRSKVAQTQLAHRLQAALPLIRAEAALGMAGTGTLEQTAQLLVEAGLLGFMEGATYLCAFMSLYPRSVSDYRLPPLSKSACIFMIEKVCSEFHYEALAAFHDHDTVVVHLRVPNPDPALLEEPYLRSLSQALFSALSAEYEAFLSFGHSVPTWTLLPSSAKAGQEGLSYSFYRGRKRCVFPTTSIRPRLEEAMAEGWIREFEDLMTDSAPDPLSRFLQHTTWYCREHEFLPVDEVKRVYARLASKLLIYARKQGIGLQPYPNEETALWESLVLCESLEDSHRMLEAVIEQWRTNQRMSEPVDIIQQARRYIDAHYRDEDLSLPQISSFVFLAPAYLSSIFKQKTGRTLTQYISEVRIEHAIVMLRSTDKSIAEIAEAVGLKDANYFSRVFRKQTGQPPSAFRKRLVP
ncbi:response regulator [Paenibacillus roseipurpureus]|uniref:Response regulator n=1 Tax=Paenibacillus roseopurpureus TaxID=2918901 RepID=A0AA96LLN7_9BACL|nr:response regulator [Paenibacillus sp. MBLB1832]WNR42896.1 response regulator [Paenibacillus sp. MBLB1832]